MCLSSADLQSVGACCYSADSFFSHVLRLAVGTDYYIYYKYCMYFSELMRIRLEVFSLKGFTFASSFYDLVIFIVQAELQKAE